MVGLGDTSTNGRARRASAEPTSNGVVARDRLADIQRARMLAAMVEVSVERGAANVSVAHVVERAGVSRRTFYEIFSGREDCFLAALEDGIAHARRYVLDRYDLGADWVSRIRMGLTASLRYLEVEQATGSLLVVGSLGGGVRALERRRRLVAQMAAVVDEGRKRAKSGSEPPPLTAEGIVGGVLSIIHSRLMDRHPPCLVELTSPLMSMIVSPYLGPAAARRELARATPPLSPEMPSGGGNDPLRELEMRLTYRTIRVLMALGAHPGSSNRQVADKSGISDQGQISKLLARLQGVGLVENTETGAERGGPNAWTLTGKGIEVENLLRVDATP